MKHYVKCKSCNEVFEWRKFVLHACKKQKAEILDMSPRAILDFTKDWKTLNIAEEENQG